MIRARFLYISVTQPKVLLKPWVSNIFNPHLCYTLCELGLPYLRSRYHLGVVPNLSTCPKPLKHPPAPTPLSTLPKSNVTWFTGQYSLLQYWHRAYMLPSVRRHLICGHTAMNLPRLVRSAQTSIAGAREYWRGWPVENTVLPQVFFWMPRKWFSFLLFLTV